MDWINGLSLIKYLHRQLDQIEETEKVSSWQHLKVYAVLYSKHPKCHPSCYSISFLLSLKKEIKVIKKERIKRKKAWLIDWFSEQPRTCHMMDGACKRKELLADIEILDKDKKFLNSFIYLFIYLYLPCSLCAVSINCFCFIINLRWMYKVKVLWALK